VVGYARDMLGDCVTGEKSGGLKRWFIRRWDEVGEDGVNVFAVSFDFSCECGLRLYKEIG
jgi:hypothetical protein